MGSRRLFEPERLDEQKHSSRWLHFGLGTLLFVVAVLGVLLAIKSDRVHRHQRAVARVEALGGVVNFREDRLNSAPTHVRVALDDGYLERNVAVDLSGTEVRDDDLALLPYVGKVEWLSLERTQITDAGLQHLKSLSSLTYLMLYETKTSIAGVDGLAKALPRCEVFGP